MDDKSGMAPQGGMNTNVFNSGAGQPSGLQPGVTQPNPAQLGGTQLDAAQPSSSQLGSAQPSSSPENPTAENSTMQNPTAQNPIVQNPTAQAPVNPSNPFLKNTAAPSSPTTPATPTTPTSPTTPTNPALPVNPNNQANPNGPNDPNTTNTTNATISHNIPDNPDAAKKKKIGIIVGAVCGIVALLAVVVVGVVVAINLNADPIAAAFNKILTNGLPANAQVDGTVKIVSNPSDDSTTSSGSSIGTDSSSAISSTSLAMSYECNAEINGAIETATFRNDLTAHLGCETSGGEELNEMYSEMYGIELDNIELSAEERYLDGDDVYFKIDGIADLLSGVSEAMSQVDSGASDSSIMGGSGSSSSSFFGLGQMIQMIVDTIISVDGQWLKVDVSQAKEAMQDNCTVQFLQNIKGQGNQFAEVYKSHPFITATDENVTVASKKSTVYQLAIDKTEYANFVSAAENAGLLSNYKTCLSDNHETDLINDFPDVMSDTYAPTFYVEVDSNHDFSRIYFTMVNERKGNYTIDFDLSYPSSIQVEEPKGAKDVEEIIQEVTASMMSSYGSMGNMTYGSGSLDSYDSGEYDYDYDSGDEGYDDDDDYYYGYDYEY